jgi:hypothetical protein
MAMQNNAPWCKSTHGDAKQCTVVQINAWRCKTMHHGANQRMAMQNNAPWCKSTHAARLSADQAT